MAIDATVAGASANSYVTVAAADLIAQSDMGPSAQKWLAATADEKEAALLRATYEVDGEIGRVAYPATTTQALLLPRYTDRSADGLTLVLPVNLQRATYLQAAFLLQNAVVLDQAVSFRARGLTNFSNPDGTGGQVADDPNFGAISPRVRPMLAEFTEGSVIGIIIPT